MTVRTAQEALYIACQMEKRAIQMYERALLLFADGPCAAEIAVILQDERGHLAQFEAMGGQAEGLESRLLLTAQAAGTLFSGGLVEAQRKGAFRSPEALYGYAAQEEAEAVRRYGEFAGQFTGEVAGAFRAIQTEERGHYARLCALAESETQAAKKQNGPQSAGTGFSPAD